MNKERLVRRASEIFLRYRSWVTRTNLAWLSMNRAAATILSELDDDLPF